MNQVRLPFEGQSFQRYIEELSAQRLWDCYQCGRCTAGCPTASYMDHPPNGLLRLIQVGDWATALNSEAIWLCASCLVCGSRCPRGIDPARVIDALRAICLRAGADRVAPDRLPASILADLPQQAFIAAFRKFTG